MDHAAHSWETTPVGARANVDAERCALGAALLDRDATADVVAAVTARDFIGPGHRVIFEAVVALYSHGEPTDVVSVGDALLRRGQLELAGGVAHLHALTATVTTPASAGYWAGLVADAAALRTVVDVGARIQSEAASGQANAADVLHWAASQIHAASDRIARDRSASAASAVDSAIEYVEMTCVHHGISEVPTGIADLDELTGGLRPGELTVIAGETGAGKSTLAIDIARTAAVDHGLPVAMFTMEMSTSEVAMRLLSAQAGVPLPHLRNGKLAPASWAVLAAARARFAGAPLHIDDTMTQTIDSIRLSARRMKGTGGLRLLVVDHLQLLPAGSARELKLLARELRVPVIAVSQLEHPDAKMTLTKVPVGAAQNADAVLLVAGSELELAKNRHGPTATVARATRER